MTRRATRVKRRTTSIRAAFTAMQCSANDAASLASADELSPEGILNQLEVGFDSDLLANAMGVRGDGGGTALELPRDIARAGAVHEALEDLSLADRQRLVRQRAPDGRRFEELRSERLRHVRTAPSELADGSDELVHRALL